MLSEREQRLLAELEAQVRRSDPKFASLFSRGPAPSHRVPAALIVLVLCGFGFVLVGIAAGVLVLSLVGALLAAVSIFGVATLTMRR